jgi:hypothetical protein
MTDVLSHRVFARFAGDDTIMDQLLDISLLGLTSMGFIVISGRQLLRNIRSYNRPGNLVDGAYWGNYSSQSEPHARPTVNLPRIAVRDSELGDEVPRVCH